MEIKSSRNINLLLIMAVIGVFSVNILVVMIGPLLVDIANDFHISIALAGQLAGFMAIPWLIVAVISGPISDTYGRKSVLLTGLGIGIIGTIGTSFAWNFISAIIFRALSGMAGVVPTNVTAVISDYVPIKGRGKALGYITIGAGLGGVIGVPLMTILADATNWRWSFVAAGFIEIIAWSLILVLVPKSNNLNKGNLNLFSRFKPLLRQRVIWDLTLINVFQRTGLTILLTYFASYLIIEHNFSTAQTSIPFSIVSAGMILASVIGGFLADTKHRMLLGPFALVLSGILGFAIFAIKLDPITEIGLGFLYAACAFSLFPIIATLFTIIGGDLFRGTALGMLPISNQFGSTIGPALGGLALSIGGFSYIGIVCLTLGIVGSILAPFLLKEKRVEIASKTLALYKE